jgi:hypothetical protein
MDMTGHPEEWTFADGTKLMSYRITDVVLRVYYAHDGVVAFSASRKCDGDGSKTQFTTWQRGEGFIGAIATATSDPDLGTVRPAEPMDLGELAEIINAHGSGIPEPMRAMILQTLHSSPP